MKNTIVLLGLVLLPFLAVSQLQIKKDYSNDYNVAITYFRDVEGVPASAELTITNIKIHKDPQSSDEYVSFDYKIETKYMHEIKLTVKMSEKRKDFAATVDEYFLKGEPIKSEGTLSILKKANHNKLIILMTMPSGDKEYADFYLIDNEIVLSTVTLNSYKKNSSH